MKVKSQKSKVKGPFRLLRDTNGQVLLLGVVALMALLAFMLIIPNGTLATTQKMRAQTAADAGACTGSVWLARALNLSANMNVGIRSMYTWMTVLTMGEALALALHNDSLDASVRALGSDMTLALFGNSDPAYTATWTYPQSIQKLAQTAQWLQSLQSDIAGSFPAVAQTLGTGEARQNASAGNSSSQNPGGVVLVRAADSLSLVASTKGDSLMLGNLTQLAGSLQNIPTNDSNVGVATGRIIISSNNYEIKAYYGDSSNWCTVRQVLAHMYKDYIEQLFYNNNTCAYDTGFAFLDKPGGSQWSAYLHGDSWVAPFRNPPWTWLWSHPGNNKYKRDTVVIRRHVVKKADPGRRQWVYQPWADGDSILNAATPYVLGDGDFVDSSTADPTDFYRGAESTNGNQGTLLRPRRSGSGNDLCAVSYVWRLGSSANPLGASSVPLGLSPAIGRAFFPQGSVASACPMLAVSASAAYLANASPSDSDYFFSPNWDVKLTALDSAGVQEICSDTAYSDHSLNSIDLANLRKYVLLP